MADYTGSNTPVNIKDKWQTPLFLFNALDKEFGFKIDVAASDDNALCHNYFTEEDSALDNEWDYGGAVYCNPPYSNITPWILKAAEQSQKHGIVVVMLVPADQSVGWFKKALETVSEVRLITGGRISFVNAETKKPVGGNNKGSQLLIWSPFRQLQVFSTVEKSELRRLGG